MERFYHDEKILSHVKLVGCLFIIHYSKTCENKEGIIKILVYMWPCLQYNYNWWQEMICKGCCFMHFDQILTDFL